MHTFKLERLGVQYHDHTFSVIYLAPCLLVIVLVVIVECLAFLFIPRAKWLSVVLNSYLGLPLYYLFCICTSPLSSLVSALPKL